MKCWDGEIRVLFKFTEPSITSDEPMGVWDSWVGALQGEPLRARRRGFRLGGAQRREQILA